MSIPYISEKSVFVNRSIIGFTEKDVKNYVIVVSLEKAVGSQRVNRQQCSIFYCPVKSFLWAAIYEFKYYNNIGIISNLSEYANNNANVNSSNRNFTLQEEYCQWILVQKFSLMTNSPIYSVSPIIFRYTYS